MSSYLEQEDSASDDEKTPVAEPLSSEDEATVREKVLAAKAEGNTCFGAKDFEAAITHYTEAIKLLKSSNLPPDDVILCNRSAAYLGLKRYVPACHDAIQAANANPDNWKAHWRQGVALMSMAQRPFRSKQAIAAFESCLQCSTLPADKHREVSEELQKAKRRLEAQDAAAPMPDMSNCAPS